MTDKPLKLEIFTVKEVSNTIKNHPRHLDYLKKRIVFVDDNDGLKARLLQLKMQQYTSSDDFVYLAVKKIDWDKLLAELKE